LVVDGCKAFEMRGILLNLRNKDYSISGIKLLISF
jgi:hypothetical protein